MARLAMPAQRSARGWASVKGKALQAFWAARGQTPGYAGCQTAGGVTPPGRWPNYHHSSACQTRRAEWEHEGMVRSEAAMTVMKRPREALEGEQEPVRDSRPRQEAASSSSGPVTQPRLPPTVAEPIGQDMNINGKVEEKIQRGCKRARDDQNYEECM